MSGDKQPRAAFTVQVTEQDYIVAARVAAHTFRRAARRDYKTYRELYPTLRITLWEDTLTAEGADFARHDPYALFKRMIETRTLFVLLREDGSFLVLPKHDLPLDGGRVPEFLRATFARKYSRR